MAISQGLSPRHQRFLTFLETECCDPTINVPVTISTGPTTVPAPLTTEFMTHCVLDDDFRREAHAVVDDYTNRVKADSEVPLRESTWKMLFAPFQMLKSFNGADALLFTSRVALSGRKRNNLRPGDLFADMYQCLAQYSSDFSQGFSDKIDEFLTARDDVARAFEEWCSSH